MNAGAGAIALPARPAPLLIGVAVAASFLALFGSALASLTNDWVTSGEYGHGFLLVPIAVGLGWKSRVTPRPRTAAGLTALLAAVALFIVGALAGDPFTQRLGILGAVAALVVHYRGREQLRAWWLPFALVASSIPLPDVVLDTITLPLQLLASDAAVWLLQARHIPASQAGNVIFLPGQELFVAAACSGLRSLSALIGLTLLIGGTSVRTASARVLLLALAVPAAIGANVLRVFATGFGAYYFGPEVAQGLSHHAMAALAFTLPLGLIALAAWLVRRAGW